MPTLAGALRCQRDSYLRVLQTKVVSCEKSKDGFAVEFEDTVLFPEGGGQPFDTGVVVTESSDPIRVSNVQRVGLHAIHTLSDPLSVGEAVTLQIDWARRLDHMQQHTGQHLLSAVLDSKKIATVGWNMGVKFNYVELDRKMTPDEVREAQLDVNDLIARALPISVSSLGHDEEKGAMRVVSIGDMDKNACCGTHLATTAEIGALLLLHQMPNKGNSRLMFMAGNRVTEYAKANHELIRSVNVKLSSETDTILSTIEQWQLRQKAQASQLKSVYQDLAAAEGLKVREALQNQKVYVLHKPDLDIDYLRVVEKQLANLQGTAVLLSGQGSTGGAAIVVGTDADQYGVELKNIFKDIKGGGKGRWQAKVMRYNKGEIDQALELK